MATTFPSAAKKWNKNAPPRIRSQFRGSGHTVEPYLRLALLTIAALAVAVLIALRLFGDQVPGAPFLRAFVARGVFFGTIFMAVWTVFAVIGRLVGFTKVGVRAGLLPVFSFGTLINVALTLTLAALYDDQIIAHAAAAKQLTGFTTLHYPNQAPVTLRQRADGAYEHREPLSEVTEREVKFLAAAEDHRLTDRQTGIDLEAVARAVLAWIEGRPLQGASGINAQLAALLFDIRSGGSGADRWKKKLVKTAISLRVDDLFSREELVGVYLSLCPFGTINGHEIRGIVTAARQFYGVEHTQLSDGQLAELFARLKSPTIYFPYQRAGETEEKFLERRARLIERAAWILQRAEAAGTMTPTARQQAESQLLSGLRSAEALMDSLDRPRLYSVMDEIRRRVPDVDSRRIEVEVAFDEKVQSLLEDAAKEALSEIVQIAPMANHPDDQILVDAIVIDPSGGIIARMGLENIPGGKGSEVKPEVYAQALEQKKLYNMGDRLHTGLTAEQALIMSDNDTAREVAQQRVGLKNLQAHFLRQGFDVTGPYASIAIGSGVSASPRASAGAFAKFSYTRPGFRVEPDLLLRVQDVSTGEVLFEPRFIRVFSRRTVLEVRRALEKVSLIGTARRLAPLAKVAPIACKTGTTGFRAENGQWKGNGGSWGLAADSRTKTVIAVRIRWKSGRPFEINGGDSAVLVVRHFIGRLRESITGGTPVPPFPTGGTPVPPFPTGGTPVPPFPTGGTPVPPSQRRTK